MHYVNEGPHKKEVQRRVCVCVCVCVCGCLCVCVVPVLWDIQTKWFKDSCAEHTHTFSLVSLFEYACEWAPFYCILLGGHLPHIHTHTHMHHPQTPPHKHAGLYNFWCHLQRIQSALLGHSCCCKSCIYSQYVVDVTFTHFGIVLFETFFFLWSNLCPTLCAAASVQDSTIHLRSQECFAINISLES